MQAFKIHTANTINNISQLDVSEIAQKPVNTVSDILRYTQPLNTCRYLYLDCDVGLMEWRSKLCYFGRSKDFIYN